MGTVTEKTLRKLALLSSLLGIALLFFVSQTLTLDPLDINQLTIDDVGKTVRVCGVMENKFVSKNNHTFFDLKDDSGKIKIVVFSTTAKILEKFKTNLSQVNNGDDLCVTGEVDEWEYELEVKCKKLEVN